MSHVTVGHGWTTERTVPPTGGAHFTGIFIHATAVLIVIPQLNATLRVLGTADMRVRRVREGNKMYGVLNTICIICHQKFSEQFSTQYFRTGNLPNFDDQKKLFGTNVIVRMTEMIFCVQLTIPYINFTLSNIFQSLITRPGTNLALLSLYGQLCVMLQ